MANSAKKPAPAGSQRVPVAAAKPLATGKDAKAAKPTFAATRDAWPGREEPAGPTKPPDSESKQSRVIAMLQSPAGATIAAMMKATGWQQHSVRGFLAGVVRKRLKLKLGSKKVDGNRVYQIAERRCGKPDLAGTKRRPA